jgi:hypothetical protein
VHCVQNGWVCSLRWQRKDRNRNRRSRTERKK